MTYYSDNVRYSNRASLPQHTGDVGDLQARREVLLRVGRNIQAAHPGPHELHLLVFNIITWLYYTSRVVLR